MAVVAAPIVLDGSYGEGGSALLRTGLALSAITEQALRIDMVRGGTKFPGLTPEDLAIAKALAMVCQAETVGAEVGSNTISFLPTRRPRNWRSENGGIGAGPDGALNANVVLNTLLPVLARTGAYSSVVARGETYGLASLSYDYFANATLLAYRKLGLFAIANQQAGGFGRMGQGEVLLDVEPSYLQGFNGDDRGQLRGIHAIVTTSDLPDSVGHRGVAHLERLAQNVGMQIRAEASRVLSREPGAFITVWAEYDRGVGGGGVMGQKGVRVEAVAQQAFQSVFDFIRSGATFDPFLADQVIVAAALAEGETTFKVSRLTERFLTQVWVIKQFLPIPITIKGTVDQPGTVKIRR